MLIFENIEPVKANGCHCNDFIW